MPSLDRWLPRLQEQLSGLARAHDVPGAACGVLVGDDVVVATTGVANVATGAPVVPGTLFQVGEVSEAYTATLLLQAEQAALVKLDEPVRAVLHSFRLGDDTATLEVTPRHLLAHSSGIEADHTVETGSGPGALDRFVAALGGVGQVHPPDELYSHSSSGYAIAGRLVEVLTGEPFDRALQRRLVGELGTATTVRAEDALLQPVAAGHAQRADGSWAPCWGLAGHEAPSGGVLAPVDELLAFARVHLRRGTAPGGGEVLPAEAVVALQEPHVEMYGVADRRALGWVVWDWDGLTAIGHDGRTPGQRCALRIVPARGTAVALMTNAPSGELVAHDLLPWVAGELLGAAVPGLPEGVVPDAAGLGAASPRAGSYRRLHQRIEVLAGEGRMAMSLLPGETLARRGHRDATLELQPVGADRYCVTDPRTGAPRIVTFVATDSAEAAYLHYEDRAHRRAGDA